MTCGEEGPGMKKCQQAITTKMTFKINKKKPCIKAIKCICTSATSTFEGRQEVLCKANAHPDLTVLLFGQLYYFIDT
jgi:hypothetical protein